MPAVRNEALTFNGSLYLPLAGGTMTGAILASPDNAIDLGSPAGAWRALYTYGVDNNGAVKIGPTLATSVELGRNGQTLQANAHVTPAADGTLDVGATAKVWRNVYTLALTSNSGLTVDAVTGITIASTNASSLALGRAAITTTVNGTLRYDLTSGTAHPGGGSVPPGNVEGYLVVDVGGVLMRVPYFVA